MSGKILRHFINLCAIILLQSLDGLVVSPCNQTDSQAFATKPSTATNPME